MSRQAVYAALNLDSELHSLGIPQGNVFPNWSMDGSPTRDALFLILRWEENPIVGIFSGPRILTVWAHCPRNIATDFAVLDLILRRVKTILTSMEHVAGTDGYTVTTIRATGEGGDLTDPAYDTITRNSAFQVLFRQAA